MPGRGGPPCLRRGLGIGRTGKPRGAQRRRRVGQLRAGPGHRPVQGLDLPLIQVTGAVDHQPVGPVVDDSGLLRRVVGRRIGPNAHAAHRDPGRRGSPERLGQAGDKAEILGGQGRQVGAGDEGEIGHIDQLLQLLGGEMVRQRRQHVGIQGLVAAVAGLNRAHNGDPLAGPA